MGQQAQQAGTTDQFDDLIMDPEGASEGTPEMSQKNQGYEGEGTPPAAKEEPKVDLETFENLDPNSQLKTLEDKEDLEGDDKESKDKEPEKKDEGKEEKPKDGKSDEEEKSEEGTKEEEKGPKIEGKVLKLFQGDKKYEIPSDAVVKTKVDGKWEKVTVSELRDSYSGKQAWNQRVEEANATIKDLSGKEAELTRVQTSLKNTMDEVATGVKDAISGHGNPMDAVNKILDLLKVDSYDFNEALFNSLTEELVTLDQMDEYERKAYNLEKRNEHLLKRHESFEETMNQSKAQEDRLVEVDRIREANGVSEEDFVSAFEQLSQMGKEVKPEQVVQYAANLPFVTAAEELLTPYEDQLSDDEFDGMLAKVANTMKTNKSITNEDMATWLAENYEVESIIDQANNKAGKLEVGERDRQKAHVPSQRDLYSKDTSVESFEDFDY